MMRGGQRRMELRPAPSTQQAAFEGQRLNALPELRRALLGLLINHQFEADHETEATDVADMSETLGPIAQAIENMTADGGRVRDQLLFEQLDGRQGPPPPPPDFRRTWKREHRGASP